MPLDPAACAQTIASAYFSGLNMPISNSASDYGSVPRVPPGPIVYNPAAYRMAFGAAYNVYAMAGKVTGTNLLPVTPGPGPLVSGFAAVTGQGPANITKLASALATFWAGSFLVGLPFIGVSFVSAVNDAAGKVSAFKAAIASSYTTQFDAPCFETLIKNIEAVVKTIIWTCIDLVVVGPATVPITYIGGPIQ